MESENINRCLICENKLIKIRVYSSECNPWRCSNKCVKCEGCYGFCECSKIYGEMKECKYCVTKITIDKTKCDECCVECEGDCNNICEECNNVCDSECDCLISCGFCDNKIRHFDFIHDEEYQCNTSGGGTGPTAYSDPMCGDCGSKFCYNCEGPCAEPCEDCGACDECNCKEEKEKEKEKEEEEDSKNDISQTQSQKNNISNEPSWRNCKDCCEATLTYPSEEVDRIAQENQLSCGSQFRELQGTINLATLCNKCILITPCSVCKKIVSTQQGDSENCKEESEGEDNNSYESGHTIRLEISNYNQEPICSECKNIQCYRCGEDGYEKTWYGLIICEVCGKALCNICGGECNNPCSQCERPCDNDCNCSEEEEENKEMNQSENDYTRPHSQDILKINDSDEVKDNMPIHESSKKCSTSDIEVSLTNDQLEREHMKDKANTQKLTDRIYLPFKKSIHRANDGLVEYFDKNNNKYIYFGLAFVFGSIVLSRYLVHKTM